MNDPTQAFWDDLNHNLADPEFRAAYEKERLAMSTADLIAAGRRIAALVPTSEAGETLTGLADALEAATKPPETATCLECEGEGHFTVTFVFGDRRVACDVCDGTGRVAVGGTE